MKTPFSISQRWGALCLLHAPSLFRWVTGLSLLTYGIALICLLRRLMRPADEDPVLETTKWMALGLAGFFLFLKQSFFNYYYVIGGLLAFYPSLAARHDPRGPGQRAAARAPGGA